MSRYCVGPVQATTLKGRVVPHLGNPMVLHLKPNNYQDIAKVTAELLTKSDFIMALEELSRVSEFIIHIHQVYSVKLYANSADEKDSSVGQNDQNCSS